MEKTYLITGAGGRVGSRLVRVLCKNNIDYVKKLKLVDIRFNEAIKADQAKWCETAGIKAEWIEGDITDYQAMTSAMTSVTVVLHLAALIDYTGQIPNSKLWKINVEGTENILKCCLDKNVRYCLCTSSIEAVGPNYDMDPYLDCNENTPYKHNPAMYYAATKHEAEIRALRANGMEMANGKRLVTCALRPGGVYGDNDVTLGMMVQRTGPSKLLKSFSEPSAVQERMFVGNVAWAHLLAAKIMQETPEVVGGNAYFIGDETPKLSYTRLNLKFCEHLGYTLAKPDPYVPRWVFYLIACIYAFTCKLLSWFGIHKPALLTPAAVRVVCTPFTTSYAKFKKDFGYEPLYSWEEALQSTKRDVEMIVEKEGLTVNRKTHRA
uniref:3-beta hydroxysteroid dehydrogenase/isomerase domain-containing protein n=1 Tax=Ciona savignyi TaxID=51511 RepID=H2ZF16_CIOSA